MNSKTNEILNDVIHAASQAILCEDESVKRQAMADIVDALAGVIPSERAARGSAPTVVGRDVLGAPQSDSSDGRGRSPSAPENGRGRSPSAPRFKARFNGINAVDIFASSLTIKGHKLTGAIELDTDDDWQGTIFDNGVAVGYVSGMDRGKNFVRKMMIGAMRGIASYVGHHQRLNANRKIRTEKESAS